MTDKKGLAMRACIPETGDSEPKHGHGECDPVLNSINHGEFEEIYSPHQRDAIRILRSDRLGLSLYIHFPDEHLPQRARYAVAYEGDKGNRHIQQMILQSNRSNAVLELLDLINQYTRCLCQQLLKAKSVSNRKVALSKTRRIGSFHRTNVRKRIRQSLLGISQDRVTENAYRGFVNAVQSGVDEWLLLRSTSNLQKLDRSSQQVHVDE